MAFRMSLAVFVILNILFQEVSSSGPCVDHSPMCGVLPNMCTDAGGYVVCPKTCHACPTAGPKTVSAGCVDLSPSCDTTPTICDDANGKLICPMTCNACPTPKPTTASSVGCMDLSPTCATTTNICADANGKLICPATCSTCPTTTVVTTASVGCVDLSPTCATSPDICNEANGRVICPLTCNVCPTSPTTTGTTFGCVDLSPICGNLADICADVNGKLLCPATCNACPGPSTVPTTPANTQAPTTVCDNQPCANGGTCKPLPRGQFECLCPAGTIPPLCLLGENPTTQKPTTQNPTTKNPTTQMPTTQMPTTQKLTTQVPTTEKPTTQNPSTQIPTTKKPTTPNPTTQTPTTKIPTTQIPTTQIATSTDGWIVFQRRTSDSVDFYRNWANYTQGFGTSENLWLGLDNIYSLCNQTHQCTMRVDMRIGAVAKFAEYGTFWITGPHYPYYMLHLGDYSGTAGDSMMDAPYYGQRANGQEFSTFDYDNDGAAGNCAILFGGGWWFGACTESLLNGVFGTSGNNQGVYWNTFNSPPDRAALTFVEMKLRQH